MVFMNPENIGEYPSPDQEPDIRPLVFDAQIPMSMLERPFVDPEVEILALGFPPLADYDDF